MKIFFPPVHTVLYEIIDQIRAEMEYIRHKNDRADIFRAERFAQILFGDKNKLGSFFLLLECLDVVQSNDTLVIRCGHVFRFRAGRLGGDGRGRRHGDNIGRPGIEIFQTDTGQFSGVIVQQGNHLFPVPVLQSAQNILFGVIEMVGNRRNTGGQTGSNTPKQIEIYLYLRVVSVFHVFVNKAVRKHSYACMRVL